MATAAGCGDVASDGVSHGAPDAAADHSVKVDAPAPPRPGFTEYAIPEAAEYITSGPDGALWFTMMFANGIGRLTTDGAYTKFPLPSAGAGPTQVVSGPDGALWFTEQTANAIGRITTSGVITEFPAPTPNSGPSFIALGPDGALWFGEHWHSAIGRVTTAGDFTEYALSDSDGPGGPTIGPLTAGPDNALWFSGGSTAFGRISMTGEITTYGLPGPFVSMPQIAQAPSGDLWMLVTDTTYQVSAGRLSTTDGTPTAAFPVEAEGPTSPWLTWGPDGSLWWPTVATDAASATRRTTAGVVTSYPMPAGHLPLTLTAGSDGAMWFTEAGPTTGTNRIGRIVAGPPGDAATTSPPIQKSVDASVDARAPLPNRRSAIARLTMEGVLTEFPLPAHSQPYLITPGPDGAMWFYFFKSGNLGRITTDGALTELPPPTSDAGVLVGVGTLLAGPDGAMWFTEGGALGRMTTDGVVSEFPTPNGSDSLVVGPDGALWFTEQNGVGRMTTDGAYRDYPLPADKGPTQIVAGSDGSLWISEASVPAIARLTMSGELTEFPLPQSNAIMQELTAGPDGAIWYELAGYAPLPWGDVGRLTTAGAFSEPFTGKTSVYCNIYCTGQWGSDGAFWWGDPVATFGLEQVAIRRLTTDGSGSMFMLRPGEIPLPDAYTWGATGPDGALWFTEIGLDDEE